MEVLKQRYANYVKAISTLKNMVKQFHESTSVENHETTRDALIKRFEYSIDTLWKLLKNYIEVQHSITAASPRAVLKLCSDNNIITEKQYVMLIKMVEDRNITSHTYNEKLAEQISSKISDYYIVLEEVARQLSL